jgi:hypothetical protein
MILIQASSQTTGRTPRSCYFSLRSLVHWLADAACVPMPGAVGLAVSGLGLGSLDHPVPQIYLFMVYLWIFIALSLGLPGF